MARVNYLADTIFEDEVDPAAVRRARRTVPRLSELASQLSGVLVRFPAPSYERGSRESSRSCQPNPGADGKGRVSGCAIVGCDRLCRSVVCAGR